MNENRQGSAVLSSPIHVATSDRHLVLYVVFPCMYPSIWLLGMVLSQTGRQCQSPGMILGHTPSDTVRWCQALSLWLVFFSSSCSLGLWLWMILRASSNFEKVASVSCRCSLKKGCFQNLREQQEVTGALRSYYRHSEWSLVKPFMNACCLLCSPFPTLSA